MDQKLKEKILREQDCLIYFSYNSFEECLFTESIDGLDTSYSSFNNKFLAGYLEIIPELKTKNLLYLVTSSNKDVKEAAKKALEEKVITTGEHVFSGENVKKEVFGHLIDLRLSALSAVGEDNKAKIRENILEKYKQIEKDAPYAYSIIRKGKLITSVDNFLYMYEQGIFTPEKLQLLEKLANENPNILDTINYKIFDDSIFEMGEDFISKIARYPNVSNKLIMIAENNPQLFSVIKQGFSELEENRGKPEILELQNKIITYAAKKFPQIEDISFEDLANRALRADVVSISKNEHISTQDYEAEFDRRCDEQYEKLSQSSNTFKYPNAVPEKKKILLMKYFGMDRAKAEEFCNRFGHDIDSIEVLESEAKEYLERVKAVLELETEDEIDELYYSMSQKVTPLERLHHEYVLRESYAQTYVDAIR